MMEQRTILVALTVEQIDLLYSLCCQEAMDSQLDQAQRDFCMEIAEELNVAVETAA